MTDRKAIGKTIAKMRERKGYTQSQLAKIAQTHKSTISEIENGKFTGSHGIFERVINAVGLSFEVKPLVRRLPKWDEIDSLFNEDDE